MNLEIPLAHAHFLVALFPSLSLSLSLAHLLCRPFSFMAHEDKARSSKRVHGRLRNGLSSTREVSGRSCARRARDDSQLPRATLRTAGCPRKGTFLRPSRNSRLGRDKLRPEREDFERDYRSSFSARTILSSRPCVLDPFEDHEDK